MAIHILDAHTAELIAAGEVVERPASVVKELLENAIDAGAKQVTVTVQRGGIELLEIADDGEGIDADDIPLAFVRHATSKVRTEKDLEAIGTLGFRGEALASIASVARVELLTCTKQAEFASLYRIEGGIEMGLEEAARGVGTTITVRDIFYNTPARMKFLKKDTSEAGYVTENVTRLALSHPEVAVRYVREGKQVFATPGDGDMHSAAYAVLGADFARDLVRVEGEMNQYTVAGYVTPPRAARASRSMQFFFINGRFVKNRTMMAAVEQACRGMLMGGRFPGCVLGLSMPPELVDVNVHPAKTEVRFAREKDIFDAVYRTVKNALLQNAAAHSRFSLGEDEQPADATAQGADGQSAPTAQRKDGVYRPQPIDVGGRAGAVVAQRGRERQPVVPCDKQLADTLSSDANAAPYETRPKPPVPDFLQAQTRVREPALDIEPDEDAGPGALSSAPTMPPEPAVQTSFAQPGPQEGLRLVGEVFKTYILAEAPGGVLCVIDKHAAHERIIYERLVAGKQDAQIQQLLAPVAVALSAEEKAALLENAQALEAAGIEVDDFGGNAVAVRGVPADVEPKSVEDLIVEVARRLAVNSRDNLNEKTEWVLHSVSCRAAVKAGDTTRPQELLQLARDILEGSIPPFCPHGRPVVLEITRKELEKQFGRLG